uniref:Putative secreted protein n=1 Tax=Ixodes ricinus TaxID=34613 RepID=A0A0K8R4P4_IXORI
MIAHPFERIPCQSSGSLLTNHTASKPCLLSIRPTKPHSAKGKREVFCTQPQVLCTTPQLVSRKSSHPQQRRASLSTIFLNMLVASTQAKMPRMHYSTALQVHSKGTKELKKKKKQDYEVYL